MLEDWISMLKYQIQEEHKQKQNTNFKTSVQTQVVVKEKKEIYFMINVKKIVTFPSKKDKLNKAKKNI